VSGQEDENPAGAFEYTPDQEYDERSAQLQSEEDEPSGDEFPGESIARSVAQCAAACFLIGAALGGIVVGALWWRKRRARS